MTLAELQVIVPEVEPAPGRLERCNVPVDDITVVRRLRSHTDALERALLACRA